MVSDICYTAYQVMCSERNTIPIPHLDTSVKQPTHEREAIPMSLLDTSAKQPIGITG